MSQVQNDLASLNATGNGALQGSMRDAGTGTGFQGSIGMDTSGDATNSMGKFTDDETMGSDTFELHEELDDFTHANTNQTGVNVDALGRFDAGSVPDSGHNTAETQNLGWLNANDFISKA